MEIYKLLAKKVSAKKRNEKQQANLNGNIENIYNSNLSIKDIHNSCAERERKILTDISQNINRLSIKGLNLQKSVPSSVRNSPQKEILKRIEEEVQVGKYSLNTIEKCKNPSLIIKAEKKPDKRILLSRKELKELEGYLWIKYSLEDKNIQDECCMEDDSFDLMMQ